MGHFMVASWARRERCHAADSMQAIRIMIRADCHILDKLKTLTTCLMFLFRLKMSAAGRSDLRANKSLCRIRLVIVWLRRKS